MKFIKRLIILSGTAAKGTLMIERNAFGVWVRLSTFNLPKTAGGYELALIMGGDVALREVPFDGKLSFELKTGDVEIIHAAVVTDAAVELYGTNDSKRMWQSNILDAVRRKHDEEKSTQIKKYETPTEIFSGRQGGVEDYFFDIVPGKQKYEDFAIADSNYFENGEGDMSQLKNFSETNDDNLGRNGGPAELEMNFVNELCKNRAASEPALRETAAVDIAPDGGEKEIREAVGAPCQNEPLRAGNDDDGRLDPPELPNPLPEAESGQAVMALKQELPPDDGDGTMNRARATLRMPVDSQRGGPRPAQRNGGAYFAGDYTPKDSVCFKGARGKEGMAFCPPGAKMNAAPFDPDKNIGAAYSRRATFFENSRTDIEKLFTGFPKFAVLEKLIPGSRWVKVDYDNAGKYYVVGITEDYLCYGVPANYTAIPPKELDGYCQWLPLTPDMPAGEGFWLMYQDLKTGETLKASR